jgi:7,8-dihydropterin-6-yl-methyl-4-(beta-D-ribofuranosyl)aminobenzene 5'-phosphate synthase
MQLYAKAVILLIKNASLRIPNNSGVAIIIFFLHMTDCKMHITVVYDNHAYRQDLETGWGFSAYINRGTNSILFDTGPGGALVGNMEKLELEPGCIDTVVLSHIHPDHTGGLESFLEKNTEIVVYLPESFPKDFKGRIKAHGAKVVEVGKAIEICENVWSSGQLGKWIKEQSLVIRTDKGLVVISGCAHPGIVNIIKAAKDLMRDEIFLVTGGFHLEWASKNKIQKVINFFKKSGVQYVGPCHGSGGRARGLFEEYFGRNYINVGAGKKITLADLQ